MTKNTIPIAFLLAVIGLAGCKDNQSTSQPPPTPRPTPNPPPEVLVRMERRIEAEHAERLNAEAKLQQTEVVKSRWQSVAMLLVSGAVVALLVGTVLGSKARHDHEHTTEPH